MFVLVVVLAACGGEESGDPGCERWEDLILTEDVSDADAAAELREIASVTEDPDVADTATALAARLEDGADISTSYERMGDLCGLT